MSASAPVLIESPCVGVCMLDERGLCLGCFRTCDEITQWASLSSAERERIMDSLPEREESEPGRD